jgi:arylsulfatase A-like enzyme
MSARNLSLYGSVRHTTPYLSRFAERATVYHSHYAAGNFTSPGTASILTGMYPWSHRAINIKGAIKRSLIEKDLFALVGPEYFRMAFTQNMLADVFLRQSRANLEMHLPITTFHLNSKPPLVSEVFNADSLISSYAFDNPIVSYSMFSTLLLNYLHVSTWKDLNKYTEPSDSHPYGTPFNTYNYFHNDVVYEGVEKLILQLAEQHNPFLAYFHLFSPHDPYTPRKEFVDAFANIEIPRKPEHPLSTSKQKFNALVESRKRYDEYIANVDLEIGQLIDALDGAGIWKNTYLFIVADHGELFERGERGHLTPLMYDPVLRIPLIIFAPDQRERRDVFSPTSNVDILPTILKILGKDLPPSMNGKILLGFGGDEEYERSIFSIEAKRNSTFLPLTQASIVMIKGHKKLIHYLGYPGYDDSFELYDLQDDIEELNNLFNKDTVNSSLMKDELLDALTSANHAAKES